MTIDEDTARRAVGVIGQAYKDATHSYNKAWTTAVADDARHRRAEYEAALDARFRREAIEAYEAANPRPTFKSVADAMLGASRTNAHVPSVRDPVQRAGYVALLTYVEKTGDYAGARGLLQFFEAVARETGNSPSDIAEAAGILRVQNRDLDDAALRTLVLNVVRQGQQGQIAIEAME